MNCLPCFGDEDSDSSPNDKNQPPASADVPIAPNVQALNFRELAMATKNFRQESLLGEGGFGRVFKGMLNATSQVVAVKQLDRNGMQENKEFTSEVGKLSQLNHINLVNLIGYCADGDQRVLVYEYVPMGSLEQHLFGDGPEAKPLDWTTRMKIASGAAQALEYLHEKANPPVIYGDFKPSNILLNDGFEPKLSDVGLSKIGTGDGNTEQRSRMMGTYGYSAPEYSKDGELTLKSDIYSFGVVLLELITGRRAIDTSRPTDEQNLVTWAQPYFRDPKRFSEMADPRLNKQFPATSLNQAVGIAAMCIQDEPMVRPLIGDVTAVLSCICLIPNDVPPQPQKMEHEQKHKSKDNSSSSSDSDEDDQQSGEESPYRGQSSQISDSDDQSDEESTDNSDGSGKPEREKANRVRSRQKSRRKDKTKEDSSKGSPSSSRQTVVTFKEPSKSSKYSSGGMSQTLISSESSSDSDSDDDDGGSSNYQEAHSRPQSDATDNGSSSSEDDSESDRYESPKRRRDS